MRESSRITCKRERWSLAKYEFEGFTVLNEIKKKSNNNKNKTDKNKKTKTKN